MRGQHTEQEEIKCLLQLIAKKKNKFGRSLELDQWEEVTRFSASALVCIRTGLTAMEGLDGGDTVVK